MASAMSDAGMSSSLEPLLQQLPHRPDISGITDILPGFSPYGLSPINVSHDTEKLCGYFSRENPLHDCRRLTVRALEQGKIAI